MGVRLLVPHSPGSDPLAPALAAAAAARVSGRSFALVLPGRYLRGRARLELAGELGSCDPRWITGFAGLARRLLGVAAPRVATPRERDAYLAQALSELPGLAQHLTLRYRGFRKGLLHVFHELEGNGLSEQELARHLEGARLDPQRAGRLHKAYSGYRERLHSSGRRAGPSEGSGEENPSSGPPRLVSEADLLHLAARSLADWEQAPGSLLPELVIVSGFSELNPRELAFLDALATATEEVQVHWTVRPEGSSTLALDWPAQTGALLEEALSFERPADGAGRSSAAIKQPAVLARLREELFEPTSAPLAPQDCGALRIVRASSREDEVEVALTAVRAWVLGEENAAEERCWRDVLLVVSDPERYRSQLERVARELDVPIRVEGRRPLGSASSIQGALALLEAAARFDLGPLLVAAASPALGLSVDEADRLARAARRRGLPVLGTAERWRSLARELGGDAGAFLLEAAELGLALEEACCEELERVERASYEARGDFEQATASTRGGAGEIRKVLERLLRPASLAALGDRPDPAALKAAAAEAAAQKELLTLLGDLDRLGAPLYEERGQSGGAALRPTEQLVARVAEEVRVARFEARDARREVVVVVDARSAQARSADLVMILGLVEREFPRAPNEDQFLPEATRRALSGRSLPQASGSAPQHLRVPTAADCAAEDRFVFYSAAIGARRELWLLYPGFTAHGAPRTPSRFLADVERLLSVPAQSACTLNRSPGELVSDDPDRLMTLSAARRFAYRYVSAVSRPREAERVPLGLALFERLLRDPYERARIALSLGQPEAKLPPGPAAALERVYSSSELESYATCPYRHFVRYLVAARPVDDLATTGLDALRRGRVVHDALERIYRDGESPRRAFEREFARGVKDLDVGMEEDAFKRQALRAIEAFVSEDDPSFRTCGRLEPWGFELAFGPETESGALEIEARPLGGTITLRGQIDRVDLVGRPEGADGPQEGFVTDYKLGGREVDGKYLDAMHRGNRLQIPLYLLALERVFGVRPLGAAFAALGTRRRTGVVEPEVGASWEPRLDEQRVKLHKVALDRTLARAEDHVRRIVTGIAQGLIEPAPEEAQDCLRCDAQDVCRVDRDEARRIARRGRALPILPPQAFMKRTTPIPQT